MSNLKEYFDRTTHKPKYKIGDRVSGKYKKKVTFIGTVLIESFLSLEEGPYVIVDLDLPFIYGGNVFTHLRVKPKELKKLKVYDDGK